MGFTGSFVILCAFIAQLGGVVGLVIERHDKPQQHPANPIPSGGKLTKPGETPNYHVGSDFDLQSVNLGMYQEYIELDLFHNGLARFSEKEFWEAGLNEEDMFLIQFMADQELGHAIALSNLVGSNETKSCTYSYPFHDVKTFLEFSHIVTTFGEGGTIGFLAHLDSRPVSNIIEQSIAVEGRQQMAFRQFEGLFPMPFDFTTAVSQSMQWTLLSRYIKECPKSNIPVAWTIFPGLYVDKYPTAIDDWLGPAVTRNRTSLTWPGEEISFKWENPGMKVGPQNFQYVTGTNATQAKFAAWISQLNTTYTPLYDFKHNTAKTKIPNWTPIYGAAKQNVVNGTVYVVLTDTDLFVTPYNLSLLDSHIRAGPFVFIAD